MAAGVRQVLEDILQVQHEKLALLRDKYPVAYATAATAVEKRAVKAYSMMESAGGKMIASTFARRDKQIKLADGINTMLMATIVRLLNLVADLEYGISFVTKYN